jgi:hypothetical protein
VAPYLRGASSSTLANEVRTKVRERGFVVWLDVEGQYSPFIEHAVQASYERAYRSRG